jgi:hypothetical protein
VCLIVVVGLTFLQFFFFCLLALNFSYDVCLTFFFLAVIIIMSNKDADPILIELVVRVLGCDVGEVSSLRDIDSAVLYEACIKVSLEFCVVFILFFFFFFFLGSENDQSQRCVQLIFAAQQREQGERVAAGGQSHHGCGVSRRPVLFCANVPE